MGGLGWWGDGHVDLNLMVGPPWSHHSWTPMLLDKFEQFTDGHVAV